MKISKIVLLTPPTKWSSFASMKALREFCTLFIIYVGLNLLSSYLHEGNLLSDTFNEEIKSSLLYKIGRFPYSSLLSISLICSFLLISFINRKVSMWLLSENNSNSSKILSLELISFSYILIFLIVLLFISLMIFYINSLTYLEYFLLLNIIFSIGIMLIGVHIYRYIKISKLWFEESPLRAILIWLAPYIYVYLFIKMGV